MRALVYDSYGPPETLRLEQVPQPQPGPGEVLVRVEATSLNSWDWDLMVGTPMGRVNGPFGPPRRILGADIAGTVEAVGPGVTSLAPGDRVFGDLSAGKWGGLAEFAVAKASALAMIPKALSFIDAASLPQAGCLALQALRRRPQLGQGDRVFGDLSAGKWGGLAEFAVAKASALAMIPKALSFIDAASLPQAGCLALQALRRRPQLGQGDRVLINGAGGGVGTFAVQLAKLAGARVIAVDRAEKRDTLIALGADDFIDYRQADYTAGPDQYDLIIDVVASRPVGHYARALAEGGTFVAIGGTFGTLIQAALFGRLTGRKRRLEVLVYRVLAEDSAELAHRILAGTIKPVIDGIYPLEQGAAALRRLGDGLAIGKVIVTPAA